MGRVPYEQEPRPVPRGTEARLHREQRDLAPVREVLQPVRVLGDEARELAPELGYPLVPKLGEGALGDDVTCLPVVVAVEHDRDVTPPEPAHEPLGVARLPREPEPEDVHRRRGFFWLDAGAPPHPAPPPLRA